MMDFLLVLLLLSLLGFWWDSLARADNVHNGSYRPHWSLVGTMPLSYECMRGMQKRDDEGKLVQWYQQVVGNDEEITRAFQWAHSR